MVREFKFHCFLKLRQQVEQGYAGVVTELAVYTSNNLTKGEAEMVNTKSNKTIHPFRILPI